MSKKHFVGLLILLMACIYFPGQAQELLWIDQEKKGDYTDVHAAFRGSFTLSSDTEVEIQLSGASWYRVWLDGELFTEGPDRYAPGFPLYQVRKLNLEAGKHLIAAQVHSEGLDTRILKGIDPFLYGRVLSGGLKITVDWKSIELPGYARQLYRVSAQFGWLEWSDTREQPAGWQNLEFDDANWEIFNLPLYRKSATGKFP